MLDVQRMVLAFHEKFGFPNGRPRYLTAAEVRYRVKFQHEETKEFEEAARANDAAQMALELVDVIYVAVGTAVYMGLDLEPFFLAVHDANMAKVRAPGSGSDAKAIKPPGWCKPDGAAILARLSWAEEAGPRPPPVTDKPRVAHFAKVGAPGVILAACSDGRGMAPGIYGENESTDIFFDRANVNCARCIDWIVGNSYQVFGLCSMGAHRDCKGMFETGPCECSCHHR